MHSYLFVIFLGGALGASLREVFITVTSDLSDLFPLGVFLSNIIASFFLGFVFVLFKLKRINHFTNAFFATGVMGGLSTFSSFIYGSVEMMNSTLNVFLALFYMVSSVVFGYLFLHLGLKFGKSIDKAFLR